MTKKKQKDWLMGPLSPKKGNAKHYVQPPMLFPRPDKHCNSMMPAVETEKAPSFFACLTPPARPGADDFRKFGSVGMGC